MSAAQTFGARVDWGIQDVTPEADDPFAGYGGAEQQGLPIDLSADEPVLQEKLIELVNSEGALAERGVTCALKNRPDSTCNACPISQHEGSGEMATLCKVGRKQEQVVMELHVLRDDHAR